MFDGFTVPARHASIVACSWHIICTLLQWIVMSSAAPQNSDDKPKPTEGQPDKSAALILFMIAADTTWRMFVPTLGGTLLGLWLDKMFNAEPWYSIGGLAIGIIITAFLIRQQYKKADEQK